MPKHEPVSEGYAVIELEGREYPVRTKREKGSGLLQVESFLHLRWEVEVLTGIPYAGEPQPPRGVISFRTHRLAIMICHRDVERCQWQLLSAQVELSPERNAWYCDELVALAGRSL